MSILRCSRSTTRLSPYGDVLSVNGRSGRRDWRGTGEWGIRGHQGGGEGRAWPPRPPAVVKRVRPLLHVQTEHQARRVQLHWDMLGLFFFFGWWWWWWWFLPLSPVHTVLDLEPLDSVRLGTACLSVTRGLVTVCVQTLTGPKLLRHFRSALCRSRSRQFSMHRCSCDRGRF